MIAAGLVLLTLLVGVAGTSWGMVRAEARRKEAVQAQAAESSARAAEKAQYVRYRKTLNFAAHELRQPIASAIYTKNAQEEFNRLLNRFVAQIDAGDANDVNDRARLALQLREAEDLRTQTNPDINTVREKYATAVATAEHLAAAEPQ